MKTTRLLCIIDDAADYRFLLQQLFSQSLAAYSVRLFASGQAFLEALPQLSEKPDLIILDQHMPDLDGHETLLRLKQLPDYQMIPVVMMSAQASPEEINGCYHAGANSFLLKPIDYNTLKETMLTISQYWLELNQEALHQPPQRIASFSSRPVPYAKGLGGKKMRQFL
jgi:CheY-like chemotaxis protein